MGTERKARSPNGYFALRKLNACSPQRKCAASLTQKYIVFVIFSAILDDI